MNQNKPATCTYDWSIYTDDENGGFYNFFITTPESLGESFFTLNEIGTIAKETANYQLCTCKVKDIQLLKETILAKVLSQERIDAYIEFEMERAMANREYYKSLFANLQFTIPPIKHIDDGTKL